MSELLTPYDVADLLHVPAARVQRWLRRGELPAVILPSGEVLISADDLRVWLQARRTPPAGEVAHA